MNTNQMALQDVQVEVARANEIVELSEFEIQLIAGGTAVVNTI